MIKVLSVMFEVRHTSPAYNIIIAIFVIII